MRKVLSSMENQYGEKVPTAILYQENGMLRLWEVNCWSAKDLGLGNCLCVNHPMVVEDPISTTEIISRFGKEALDGFDEPSDAQLVFDAFGVEAHELETALSVAYRLRINPLPALRDVSDQAIVFSENPELLTFPEAEPGTVIFVVNSRGEISVREVDDNDVGMPELAIPK